jgi:hypothetical protein
MAANKKNGKRNAVVDNRLIDTSMKILRSIRHDSLIVNKVIEQTGLLDRSHFFRTKEVLIKSKLIKQTGIDGRTKRLDLCETGHDLVMLMNYIEQAQKCNRALIKTIWQKFRLNDYHLITREMALATNDLKMDQMGQAVLKKLRNLGWDPSDLKLYFDYIVDGLSFEHRTASAYVTAL